MSVPALRILVVEDVSELREVMREVLLAEGFEVIVAGDGREGFDLYCRDPRYDLLLLDDEMPRMSGRELLRALRAQGARMPALFCSGSLEVDASERASMGVAGVLRKPVTIADLTAAVRRTLPNA